MEKLSKPINVAVDGSVLSFDEPRDSYYYEVYVDDVKVAKIDSDRRPYLLGATPDIGRYYDSVTIHLLFDVPITALNLEYSLDYANWLPYNDKKGIVLAGTDTGEPYNIWVRGEYLANSTPIAGSGHLGGYTVLKSHPITYEALDPKEAEYVLQPSKCYADEETTFSISTVKDITEQETKLYYITGVNATNCTLQVTYSEDHTLATCKITNPTGNVNISAYIFQSNYDDHDVTVTNGRFSPDPFNCVYYQRNILNVYPNDGYALPQRDGISITGAMSGDTYDFSYYVGEETQDYAVIQFVPQDEPCEIAITCQKVGA